MGSYTLLDLELQSWNIQLTGLQEVRWPDSGTKNVSDTTFLWSGRKDGYHREGVALAIHRKLMPTYVSWTPAVMLTRTWDPRPRTQVTRSRPRPWGIKAKAKDFGPKAKAKDLGLKAKAKDLRCQSQ